MLSFAGPFDFQALVSTCMHAIKLMCVAILKWFSFSLLYNCISYVDKNIITGLEWSDDDFTSLEVSWDPVTTQRGREVTYRISYSPVMVNDANMCMKEVVTSCETEGSSILLAGLDPDLFYSVMAEAIIPDTDTTTGPKQFNTFIRFNRDTCIYAELLH